MAEEASQRAGAGSRIGEFLLKILAFFVILEPIWMLLPFAGFLYGSGLHIQSLARHPETSWLTHFVFPVLTLGPVGPALVVLGAIVFCIGASQIYTAKFRRSGLVSGGLYRFVRHPQYTALTLLGLGLLLAWGRAIMFVFFFLMMFLYYYLAKKEEAICVGLFGDDYEKYRERTPFCIPGGKRIDRLWGKVPALPFSKPVSIAVSFVLTVAACLGLMLLIKTIKIEVRDVPLMATTVAYEGKGEDTPAPVGLTAGSAGGVPFVLSQELLMVRGPWRSAAAPGFAENVLRRLTDSPSMADFLEPLCLEERKVGFIFCAPFSPAADGENTTPGERFMPRDAKRRGPEPDPHGPDKARLIMMQCELAQGATMVDALSDESKRTITSFCVAKVDLGLDEEEDVVVDGPNCAGPTNPGEERWARMMNQLREREALVRKTADEPLRPVGPPSAETEVILVQAPILKTRLYPRFAEDILYRLTQSPCFIDRLRKCGAGGDLVPVAFPRPGPNWYQTYHFDYDIKDGEKPEDKFHMETHGEDLTQVSAFVMLVRRKSGLDNQALFDEARRGDRKLEGAFIAELDFGIAPPEDKVHEIVIVGPRRDLEDRWTFFLSGL